MLKGDAHIRYAETFLSGLKGGILDASFKTVRCKPMSVEFKIN